ncbi:MAG TPA: GNAT family N-acetyltransferase, partial [Tepidisphaeraceae bacterium]|nr:GNAT family N-acetyltransferase [Tepidisphaeraceae bacterium]
GVQIRRIRRSDLPALLDIYNHYVLTTPITFDIEPRTLAQRMEWFGAFAETGRYQCFVAEMDGRPIGWASSGRFKDRRAYETSVELSVYLAPDAHGKGLGRKLYEALIAALRGEDIHRLYGGITLPNDASIALHEAMGFKRVSLTSEVGRKFGRYWDVALYERPLD